MSIMNAVGVVGEAAPPKVVYVTMAAGASAAVAKAGTATLSNVSSSASNGTLLASNADRIGVLVFNDSTAVLYLKYGTTASASSYSVKMEAGSYWEMPQPIYTGQLDGIWASANGAARVTELET